MATSWVVVAAPTRSRAPADQALDLPARDPEARGDLGLSKPVAQQERDLELARGEPRGRSRRAACGRGGRGVPRGPAGTSSVTKPGTLIGAGLTAGGVAHAAEDEPGEPVDEHASDERVGGGGRTSPAGRRGRSTMPAPVRPAACQPRRLPPSRRPRRERRPASSSACRRPTAAAARPTSIRSAVRPAARRARRARRARLQRRPRAQQPVELARSCQAGHAECGCSRREREGGRRRRAAVEHREAQAEPRPGDRHRARDREQPHVQVPRRDARARRPAGPGDEATAGRTGAAAATGWSFKRQGGPTASSVSGSAAA